MPKLLAPTMPDAADVDRPEPARFLVETIDRRGASRTLHLSVPRTVLLDVVADVVDLGAERPDLFTGGAAGGDSATQSCEPSEQTDRLVGLHVNVVGTGPLDVARAGLILLDRIARRTSGTYVSNTLLPTLSASLEWDWSETVPLIP